MKRDRDVVVLSLDTPTENDRRALEIATFMGAQAAAATLGNTVPSSTCLIVAADTLVRGTAANATALRNLIGAADHVAVYGFDETKGHIALLRALSSNALTGVQPLSSAKPLFGVADGYRSLCGPLSGLSLGRVDATADRGFMAASSAAPMETLIHSGGRPFLVRTRLGRSLVHFIGRSEFADLDATVERGARALDWFSRLAPLMIVLRGALGDRVWRNPSPSACFIIDDPLLTKRYGFLEYQRLIETMRPHRFFPCIAFIPWNYLRSKRNVAALLAAQYREPFLCVHGCDHTRAEFATTDVQMLEARAHLALHRMRQQAQNAGVAFDEVMVFPQGLFSVEAIHALRASGYLAAVNSDVCPSTSASVLRLRDLVDVAVTRFADFPLFGRRYPRDVAESAFDLFLGKPALLVEHHGYFRDGYDALASFVQRLNALEPALEWASLGRVCSRASVVRSTVEGETAVRFFTPRFSVSNTGLRQQSFVLTRPHSDSAAPAVLVNAREWPVEVRSGQMTVRLSLKSGESAAVQAGPNRVGAVVREAAVGSRQATSVRVRRYLSEFRDNHVDTNPALQAVVAGVRAIRRPRALVSTPRTVNL